MLEHGHVVLVVVGDEHERGAGDQRDVADQLRGNADAEIVHVGKALARREARAAVDHDGAEGERARQCHQRHGHVAGPDHGQDGRGDQHLDESADALHQERVFEMPARLAWVASATKRASREGSPRVPSTTPVSRTRSLAPLPASSSRVTMAARPPRVRVGARALVQGEGGVARPVQRDRLHEHLDGAPAGEPDLPGLLVAQIQLEQPRAIRAQHIGGLLDHLGVHAAADGDGAQDAAPVAHQHLGAFLARRGAARVDQGGQGDLPLGPAELVEVVEELGLAHRRFSARRSLR